MWESVFLTVVATAGNNIGKVLQKKGTLILPPLSFKLKVIRTYASNKAWVFGFLMDILGAFLMLLVLSQAPVSVIQPVSGCGLAILSVFSHFYLKEMMNAIDWIGITLAGIGTIGIGVGGEEQTASSISVFHLPWLAFVVAILFVLLNGWLRVYRRQRREQELMQYEVIEEIIYGLESGILFGIATVVSKMGFVFVEQEFSKLMLPSAFQSAFAAARLDLLSRLFIIIGVILMVTSTRLIRCLPMPRRSFARSGVEHNFGTRTRDTNPSAVIQASTLHHLLSPPSKTKA